MVDDALQIAKHASVSVGDGEETVNDVWPGKMQTFLWNLRAVEIEEILGLIAEMVCDGCHKSIQFRWLVYSSDAEVVLVDVLLRKANGGGHDDGLWGLLAQGQFSVARHFHAVLEWLSLNQ